MGRGLDNLFLELTHQSSTYINAVMGTEQGFQKWSYLPVMTHTESYLSLVELD